MMQSRLATGIAAEMIGAKMRKSVTPAFMSSWAAWIATPKPGEDPREDAQKRNASVYALRGVSTSDGDGDTLFTYWTVRNARGRSHH